MTAPGGETADPDGITFPLPPDASAPGLARRYLDRHGRELPDDLLADARLLVTELVTNAVLHGEPDITLKLRLAPPGVGVSVHDGGTRHAPSTHVVPAATHQAHGRGLAIVDSLAHDWGVQTDPTGKTIWFELRDGGVAPR